MTVPPSSQPDSNGDQHAAARQFACHAARLVADSHCEQTLVLDVRGISQVADYLVIATGTSDRQIRSVAQDLKDLGRLEDHPRIGLHGEETGQWVVADFADVVVHLFEPDWRTYYDLESLWADGPMVDWEQVTEPGQFARLATQRGRD